MSGPVDPNNVVSKEGVILPYMQEGHLNELTVQFEKWRQELEAHLFKEYERYWEYCTAHNLMVFPLPEFFKNHEGYQHLMHLIHKWNKQYIEAMRDGTLISRMETSKNPTVKSNSAASFYSYAGPYPDYDLSNQPGINHKTNTGAPVPPAKHVHHIAMAPKMQLPDYEMPPASSVVTTHSI